MPDKNPRIKTLLCFQCIYLKLYNMDKFPKMNWKTLKNVLQKYVQDTKWLNVHQTTEDQSHWSEYRCHKHKKRKIKLIQVIKHHLFYNCVFGDAQQQPIWNMLQHRAPCWNHSNYCWSGSTNSCCPSAEQIQSASERAAAIAGRHNRPKGAFRTPYSKYSFCPHWCWSLISSQPQQAVVQYSCLAASAVW